MHYPRLPEGAYFSFSDSLLLDFLDKRRGSWPKMTTG